MKGAFIGGSGNFSAGLAALAAEGLEISAFCTAGRTGFAAPPGAVEHRTRERLLAEPGLEFAAISLPPAETFAAALAALERGLHAVCEPPICMSSTEFGRLRAASDSSGKTIFPLQPWEHAAPWLALQKALDRELAGEVNCVSVQALMPGTAPEAGAVTALGWQAFSMLLAAVRRPPLALEARNPGGASAALHAHFGGADGFVHLAYGAHAPRLKVSVAGGKGRLEMDRRLLLLDIEGMEPETVELSSELTPGAWREAWLRTELSNFREEAGGGRPRGTGLRNSGYCVKLLKNSFYSASVKSAAVPL
jgi:predicted dehydrogenase